MQENKNLVEEALIQMKNVEEAIAENAKGILASTMKEEINQLVKESLSEQDEVDDEIETDDEVETDDEIGVDIDTPTGTDTDITDVEINTDEMPMGLDLGDDSEIESKDLTKLSDEELFKVFKRMNPDDKITVVKDGENIHLKDDNADVEYLVKMDESKNKKPIMKEEMDEATIDDIMASLFPDDEEEVVDDEEEEIMYEIEFNEDAEEDESMMDEETDEELDESEEMDEDAEEDESMMDEETDEELDESEEMDEDAEEELDEAEDMDEETDEELDEQNWEESLDETYNPKKAKKGIKPKGIGIGKGPKFSYEKSGKGGFKEDKKEGPKTMGTGKPKFEYKKGANMEGKSKIVKKAETKEAARTLGNGTRNYPKRKGLPKLKVIPNKALKESQETEVSMLREKNEEYRKALNVFREKLNEVAIFNSNLAYATRLFTEHSTTKKEKINILRRFDGVESLKESKNLYKSIKEELSKGETKSITESVETKLNKTVTSGSAVNLIESKTYENPQFLRMKDLMSKIS